MLAQAGVLSDLKSVNKPKVTTWMEGSISDEDVSQHQQIAQTFTPTAKYKLQSRFLWVLYSMYVLF